MVEVQVFLLHGKLDAVLPDVCLLQDSLEPTKGSRAVQLVGLLVVNKKIPRNLLDLLHLRKDIRVASAKVRQ